MARPQVRRVCAQARHLGLQVLLDEQLSFDAGGRSDLRASKPRRHLPQRSDGRLQLLVSMSYTVYGGAQYKGCVWTQ